MNASPYGVLGRLVIEVEPPMADLHEHISCAGEFRIENDLALEELLVKFDALVDIRSEDMNVMDVTNQFVVSLPFICDFCVPLLSDLYFDEPSYYRSGILINPFAIWKTFF